MSLRRYLPSAKFAVMAGSLVLSGGLVVAAQSITHPKTDDLSLSADASALAQTQNWQQSLSDIEAQSGVVAPQTPNPELVQSLLQDAKSPNLTTQIGQSLVVNLGSAGAQGLGQDAPTQDALVAQAAAQLKADEAGPAYASADLSITAKTDASVHTWGNGVMAALAAHPTASAPQTFVLLGRITDAQDPAALAELKTIGLAYRAIADDLVALPVPATLAPLHLQLANDFAAMAATYPDMALMLEDPLRGLASAQRYTALLDETRRVLTSLAQALSKDAILFTKDEPGTNWSAFLSS